MRKLLILILFLPLTSLAQQFYPGPWYNYYNKLGVGTGSSSDFEPNAWLQLGAAGRPAKAGVYFYPINRTLVLSPKQGMIVCDASDGHFYRWDATASAWIDLSSTAVESDPVANAKTITLIAGSGISITGASQTIGSNPTFTIINDEPDQVVSLTGIGGVSITGTYPDFTIAGSGSGDGNNYTTSIAFNTSTGIFTLGRFGMSDLTVDLDGRYIENEADPVWSSVAANYYTKTNLQTSGQAIVHWGNITSAPAFITGNQTITLSGDVTGSGATAITTTISNNAVTYAKIQDIVSQRLLGRYSGTTGDPQEIQISTGLNLNTTTGVLTATGVLTETDPIWTAAIPNYYTKTNLQTSGQSAVHWGNLTNVPSSFPTSSNLQTVTTNGRITNLTIQNTHSNTLNSGLYSNGNYEAVSATAPSYGFHRPSTAGMALYLGSAAEYDLRIRTSSGGDFNLWSSANVTFSQPIVGSTAVLRDGSGDIWGRYLYSTDDAVTSPGSVTGIMIKAGDNYLRTGSAAAIQSFIGYTPNSETLQTVSTRDYTTNTNMEVYESTIAPDTDSYAPFGVTRSNTVANLGYIAMTRAGQVVYGMGINSSNEMLLGQMLGGTNREMSGLLRINSGGGVGIGVSPSNRLVLPNNNYIAWKNAAGTSETIAIKANTSNQMVFDVQGEQAVLYPGVLNMLGQYLSTKNSTLTNGLFSDGNFQAYGTLPAYGWHMPGVNGVAMYYQGTAAQLRVRSNDGTDGLIWHSSNDGAGSGLDADYVDGVSSEQIVYGTNNSANTLLNSGSGGDLNALTKSGFYNGSSMSNAPSADWYNVIHSEHSNHGGYANQFAQRFTGSGNAVVLYARTNYNNSWGDWQTIYHSGNVPYPVFQWTSYVGNGVALSVDNMGHNTTTFSYVDAGSPVNGPVISYGGFNNNSYPMQIHGSYSDANGGFWMRTRNGDAGTWNPWRSLWHSGNFDPGSKAPSSGSGNYIQNQSSSAQSAAAWITQALKVGASGTNGSVTMNHGGTSNIGYIDFNRPNGSRSAYIGYFASGMNYMVDGADGHTFRVAEAFGSDPVARIGGIVGNGNGGGFKSYNQSGLIGDYDQNTTNPKIIWTIGDAWNSIATFYGLGYTYSDPPGTLGNQHNVVIAEAGTIGHTFQMNGNYEATKTIQTGGMVRAKGWYTNFGDGPAAEVGYDGSVAYLIGFNRTTGTYLTTTIQGAKTTIHDIANGRLFSSNVSDFTYGTWYLQGTGGGYTGLALKDAGGTPTLMYDGSGNGGIYHQGTGLWGLYYTYSTGEWHVNSSSTNVMLHTGNHTPGSAFTVVSGSNEVIESVVSNSSGHITSVTKKVIGSVPTLTSSSLTAGTSAEFLNAYVAGSGCSLQPVNNCYLQSYGGTKIATLQACVAIPYSVFGNFTRRIVATVPIAFRPVVPIKWSAGVHISADYCKSGSLSPSEYSVSYIQFTLTTSGDVICEAGETYVVQIFGGVGYVVLPIQVTYSVAPAI